MSDEKELTGEEVTIESDGFQQLEGEVDLTADMTPEEKAELEKLMDPDYEPANEKKPLYNEKKDSVKKESRPGLFAGFQNAVKNVSNAVSSAMTSSQAQKAEIIVKEEYKKLSLDDLYESNGEPVSFDKFNRLITEVGETLHKSEYNAALLIIFALQHFESYNTGERLDIYLGNVFNVDSSYIRHLKIVANYIDTSYPVIGKTMVRNDFIKKCFELIGVKKLLLLSRFDLSISEPCIKKMFKGEKYNAQELLDELENKKVLIEGAAKEMKKRNDGLVQLKDNAIRIGDKAEIKMTNIPKDLIPKLVKFLKNNAEYFEEN